MRHTIRLHGVIVGHSELENVDPDVGRAWGAFSPGIGLRARAAGCSVCSRRRPQAARRCDALLSATTMLVTRFESSFKTLPGTAIRTSAIHIADYTVEAGSAAIELDVLISDMATGATIGLT